MPASLEPHHLDRQLAALAAGQFGVFSRDQAVCLGFHRGHIAHRIDTRRWLRLHRTVYALGHAELRHEGRWLAAVLACGPDAVLSHRSAAAAWGLQAPGAARIDVSTTRRTGRAAPSGVRLHRLRSLDPDDRTRLGPIPITTIGRTLLDLAPTSSPRALEELINQADLLRRYDGRAVRALLDAHPHRAGSPKLRTLVDRLEDDGGAARTRSELEVRFLQLCDDHGLPRPQINATVAGREVDFFWPACGVVIETDGWAHHRMPGRREADAAKRLALEAAGLRVVPITWAQVADDSARTATALRAVLARASALRPAAAPAPTGASDAPPRSARGPRP